MQRNTTIIHDAYVRIPDPYHRLHTPSAAPLSTARSCLTYIWLSSMYYSQYCIYCSSSSLNRRCSYWNKYEVKSIKQVLVSVTRESTPMIDTILMIIPASELKQQFSRIDSMNRLSIWLHASSGWLTGPSKGPLRCKSGSGSGHICMLK